MARRTTKGRKLGLFIGGVMYGLIRGIFFDNKYVRRGKRIRKALCCGRAFFR